MTTDTLSTEQIIARHSVQDESKVEQIAASMSAQGWQGRPLLVVRHGDAYKALTGVHRLAAAIEAGLDDVPVVVADEGETQDVDLYEAIDAARDDDELLAVFEQYGETDAAELVRAEIAANDAP